MRPSAVKNDRNRSQHFGPTQAPCMNMIGRVIRKGVYRPTRKVPPAVELRERIRDSRGGGA
jgi:hypothetical protein